MKRIKINFRQPNVDRFIEIMAVAKNLGFSFKAHIKDMPKGYQEFINLIQPHVVLSSFEESDFMASFPENTDFDSCFSARHIGSPEAVQKRIDGVKDTVEVGRLDEPCMRLLKTAVGRLNLSPDQLQNILDLAYVIACLEGDTLIQPRHVAEATNYIDREED